MPVHDVVVPFIKRTGRDVGRKVKFWDDAAGTTAAVVRDHSNNILTQPIRVPSSGQLNLRFDQWPVYYSDNVSWATVRRVPGGTPASHIKVTLAAGTASGTDVTVAGMAVGDQLISVLSFVTAAAIASVADRTSEYVVQAGGLDKAAGTNETGNQLVIFWVEQV